MKKMITYTKLMKTYCIIEQIRNQKKQKCISWEELKTL